MSRYDDIDNMLADLETEKRYREQIEIENADLEKQILKQEAYLKHLDQVALKGSAEDNEWKCRFEVQKHLDIHLTDHKSWLEAELGEMQWRYHSSCYPEAMNYNLDLMQEVRAPLLIPISRNSILLELVRLVKHMERVKSEYCGGIRETEFTLEKETKDFHHYDEMRRTFKSDIKHFSKGLDTTSAEEIMDREAACTPPIFSPLYTRWLDSQTLDEAGGLLPSDEPAPPSATEDVDAGIDLAEDKAASEAEEAAKEEGGE